VLKIKKWEEKFMFEKLKEILMKSKEENCDLSIAHAKVRNEDRLAGKTDYTELDKAYMLINSYEAVVTKLWREGETEILEEFCKAFAENDKNAVNKIVMEWI
jgi:hypothetical protein